MTARVLIIDDEPHIRKMMRLTLETAGYEVGEAEDGFEGLGAFGDGSRWDVVLLDQRMPGLDGLETLRRLEERVPRARVIMVTAFASIELAVDAMKLGASDFLRKPMTPEMLRNSVAAVLAKPEAAAAARVAGQVSSGRGAVSSVTLNGFRFERTPDFDREVAENPVERRFVVHGPTGNEKTVVVLITDVALDQIERMTRRRIPPGSSYWTSRAERQLSEVLWNEGRIPWRRVTVGEADRDELHVAARWKFDEGRG